jgi:hypothetical protein
MFFNLYDLFLFIGSNNLLMNKILIKRLDII